MDNEDQNFLPNLLLATLYRLWQERQDWFFAVDMGLYHTSGADPKVPVVPDAFLSLGVERRKGGKSRRSYATWEENGVVPSLVLEMFSHTARREYGHKFDLYQKMGVLYYAVYNPEFYLRDQHDPFEVYKLENGAYVRQAGEPVWLPEIGLGIGRLTETFGGIEREWLAWFNEAGETYGLPEVSRQELQRERLRAELTQQALEDQRRRAEQEKLRAEEQRRRAEQEQLRAEEQRRRAEQEQLRAEEQLRRAEQEQLRAEEQRRRAEQEQLRAEEQRRRAEAAEEQARKLEKYLRSLGIDLDNLN